MDIKGIRKTFIKLYNEFNKALKRPFRGLGCPTLGGNFSAVELHKTSRQETFRARKPLGMVLKGFWMVLEGFSYIFQQFSRVLKVV